MRNFIYIILIPLFLGACKKEETGKDVSITGFVKLIDEFGQEHYSYDSVNVTINNTKSTQTPDKYGNYLFSGLEAGVNYSLEYSKEGYGTFKLFNKRFIGNQRPGLLSAVVLYQKSSNSFKNLSVTISGGNVNLKGLLAATSSCVLRFFVSTNANVSDTCYDIDREMYILSYYVRIPFASSFNIASANYKKGDLLYVAIYTDNYYGNDSPGYNSNTYYDYDLKKTFFSSAVKQQVISLVYQ